jgi:major type 1 subunit fimbrin (pilin)
MILFSTLSHVENKAKWLASVSLLLGGIALPGPTFAVSCWTTGGGTFVVNVGPRSIPQGAAIGSVVIDKIGTSTSYDWKCQGDFVMARDVYVALTVSSSPVQGYADVYPTSLPGLGVKYYFAGEGGVGCNVPFDQTIRNSKYTAKCGALPRRETGYSLGTSVQFIKTGEISSGNLVSIPGVTMSYTVPTESGSRYLAPMYSGVASGSITVPACTASDITVSLGNPLIIGFKGPGSTSTAQPFSIDLQNCPAGINRVQYELDPMTSVIDPKLSLIALEPGGASGVAIQITDNSGNPVPLQQLNATSYSAGSGSFRIPLRAAYYQTGKISPGAAKASVRFIMNYQ